MENRKEGDKDLNIERRSGKDRRTGELDQKYKYSVQAGFFLDMRKGNRRRNITEESLISMN